MTNSTAPDSKPIKKKGPLRLEAIIPLAVILALVGGYFKFFFDRNLKSAIEYVGTTVHGAEVNLNSVSTSFIRASFEMNGLQVTDKNKPQRNLFTIGTIRLQLLWDALLRGKFVVSDASILDIQALVPRKSPGRIVPPPKAKDGGPGALAQVQDSVLNQAKKQYNDNLMGDLASMLDGVDPKDQLKNIESELKSSTRIKELEKELKEKEQQWKERLKALPQAKEVEELSKRLKALKFNAKNPIEFANSVKEADKILKEADQKVKLVTETGKTLNSDVDNYTTAFKDLEKMVDQDLKDLQSRLKIPEVNAADFSKNMFMNMLSQRIISIRKYAEVAKQYMPPKKSAEEKAPEIVPKARGQGTNVRFPVTTGYPLFWLKHAAISSEVSSSAEYSGDIKGEVKDITSDPVYLGKPATIAIKGNFPKQQISGLDALVTIDHTTDKPKESFKLKVASYPVGQQQLADSNDVKFHINQANGGLDLLAQLEESTLNMQMTSAFTQMQYEIDAKNKIVKEILTNVMAGIPVVDVRASAKGSWDNLDMSLSSNLGDELSRGFKEQVNAKIEEAKAKIKSLINDKIGAEKEKLNAEFNKIKGQITGELDKSKGEIEKAKKTAQAEIDKQKSQGGSKKLEEEGKKLLKKFKLGG